MKPFLKNQRGFTLIEFIVVIAVGSFLVAGIVLFSRQQIETVTSLRDMQIALNLAKLKMAEMNNTAYASLPVGTTTLASDSTFPGFMFQRVITSVATSGTNSLRQIDINVALTTGSFASPLVKLTTYRESDTTFGDGA